MIWIIELITMKRAIPAPASNPVVNLRILLLSLRPYNCVIPSIKVGIINIMDNISNGMLNGIL